MSPDNDPAFAGRRAGATSSGGTSTGVARALAVCPTTPRRALAAGAIGHLLEWLDFGMYAYVAVILAAKFYPSSDPTTSLLASFATFGVGFVARPVGALVFGRLGDLRGRRTVLLTTLSCMAVGTFGIAVLPTHASIGIVAPMLLVLCRLLQGFSAGGEATTATAYLVEWAPENRRGFYGSFLQIGSIAGFLAATVIVALTTTILGRPTMNDWGWRVPFVIGGILILLGYVLRRRTEETPEFIAVREAGTHAISADQAAAVPAPARSSVGAAVARVLRAFMLTAVWSVFLYFFVTYMPTFLQREFGLTSTAALWLTSAAMFVHVLLVPVAAILSDRYGRKPLLLAGCAGFLLLPVPLFAGLSKSSALGTVFAVALVIGLLLALYGGTAPAALAEYFPVASRSTGMAIGYNLAAAVFGGFTPFIATWLIKVTGHALAPAYYVAAAGVAGLIFVASQRETARQRSTSFLADVQPVAEQGGALR